MASSLLSAVISSETTETSKQSKQAADSQTQTEAPQTCFYLTHRRGFLKETGMVLSPATVSRTLALPAITPSFLGHTLSQPLGRLASTHLWFAYAFPFTNPTEISLCPHGDLVVVLQDQAWGPLQTSVISLVPAPASRPHG